MYYPKILIIILNWNGKQDTLECLESVCKIDYPNFDVIVVDNGSTDDSVAAIKTAFPQVILIENKENLGFAGGNNVGIKHALQNGAEFVFLLNNDTVVDPDILVQLVTAHETLHKPGFLGCKIYFYDRPKVIQHFGGEVIFTPILSGRHIGDGEDDKGQFEKVQTCDYVTGCALLFHRNVIQKVGLLDERYFVYWEDADWGMRAKQFGYNNYVIPEAKLWHKVSASTYGAHPLRLYYFNRNRLLFASSHSDKDRNLITSAYNATQQEISQILSSGYWLKRAGLQAIRQGTRDFKKGHFGRHPEWLNKKKEDFLEYRINFWKNKLSSRMPPWIRRLRSLGQL